MINTFAFLREIMYGVFLKDTFLTERLNVKNRGITKILIVAMAGIMLLPCTMFASAILWDTTHGVYLNYSPSLDFSDFVDIMTGLGYTVDVTSTGISSMDLSDYCIVVICVGSSWSTSYTTAEADQIESYVDAGGGLLIMGENSGCPNRNINPIANRFGVTCGITTATPSDLYTTDFIVHPIFTGVSQFYVRAGGVISASSPSIEAAWEPPTSSRPIVAVAEWGSSRIVTLGDMNSLDNAYIGLADNRNWAESILTWLCSPGTPVPTPTPTVTPTPTPPPTIYCCWEPANNGGATLNSPAIDQHPTLTSDNRFLYFSSIRAGGKGRMDIYRTERIGPAITDWSTPVNLGSTINTDQEEGAPSITFNQNRLYFQAYNVTVKSFDLYYSNWDPILAIWAPRQHMGWTINSPDHDDRHPHICRDEESIYFDSIRPGGEGHFDIWMSRKFKGVWTNPRPLPDPINTSAYEAAPYIYEAAGLKQLYFESERGGVSQLYVSEWNPVLEQWDPPQLMCREFKSVLHPCINSDGSELLFHTAKIGGYGSMDIWVAECLPSPTPTGTWLSPTPTASPTATPVVPVVSSHGILHMILIVLGVVSLRFAWKNRPVHDPS